MNEITKQKILELPNNVQERLINLDIEWTKDGFNVNKNVNLSYLNLVNLPKFNIIDGNFYCFNNKLISLQGAPKEINRNFYCNYNQLTSLQYSPKKVGNSFWCDYNKLNSLQGLNKVYGTIYLTKDNLDPFTLIWVQKNYKVEFINA